MGAWIMIGLLAADIILQLSGLAGNVQWDWHEMGKRISYRMFQTAVDQANPAAAYHMRRTHKLIQSEYVPSPEDLEAVRKKTQRHFWRIWRGELRSCQGGRGGE